MIVTMQQRWWTLIFTVVSVLAMWALYANWDLRDNPVVGRIAIGYFLFICIGPYWMLYDCWTHDRKLTRKTWLFFVPGGFLWYYFERFRPRQRKRQKLYS